MIVVVLLLLFVLMVNMFLFLTDRLAKQLSDRVDVLSRRLDLLNRTPKE